MRNELRMYICEIFLHWILWIVPQSDNGRRLVLSINEYLTNELKINKND